jgi:hypothetical protein
LRQLQATTKIDTEDTDHREIVWVQTAMESVEKTLKERQSGAKQTNETAHLSGAASSNLQPTASA